MPLKMRLEEACRDQGFEERTIVSFIEHHWIVPAAREGTEWQLDEEDVARARLILELKNEFGVNDEAIPIILHLLDQLNYLVR